jgi:hypothetical protein
MSQFQKEISELEKYNDKLEYQLSEFKSERKNKLNSSVIYNSSIAPRSISSDLLPIEEEKKHSQHSQHPCDKSNRIERQSWKADSPGDSDQSLLFESTIFKDFSINKLSDARVVTEADNKNIKKSNTSLTSYSIKNRTQPPRSKQMSVYGNKKNLNVRKNDNEGDWFGDESILLWKS